YYSMFFFSSRRRHTRLVSDWSSDVCSSDLRRVLQLRYGLDGNGEHSLSETGKKLGLSHEAVRQLEFRALRKLDYPSRSQRLQDRSEERRVGKECRCGWSPDH